jgi:formate hydrogenlyase subunit 3/multisubunit Na+/H+ antiporter MnhD subunit
MGYAMFSIGVGLRYDHPAALQAGLFLLLAHAAMKGLAFLSKGVCHFYCQTTQVEELHGTFQRLPLVAVTFTLALVGLAGIPPLAGFAGKWFVLAETLKSADGLVYAGLIILLLNTLISLGYYLPLIAALYIPLPPEADRSPIAISRWMMIPLIALSLVVLTIGVLPSTWLQWVPAQVR